MTENRPTAKLAVAVMVKTPGLSPVKSRLARDLGSESAEDFYRTSCHVLKSKLRAWAGDDCGRTGASSSCGSPGQEEESGNTAKIAVYWAVAEAGGTGDPMWQDFPAVCQGDGDDLGVRLHRVYSELHRRHGTVILLGADSPQISYSILEKAKDQLLAGAESVIGPASDGGYYLIGSSLELPLSFWQSVKYSQDTTFAETCKSLESMGEFFVLPELGDVDVLRDFIELKVGLTEKLAGRLGATSSKKVCQADLDSGLGGNKSVQADFQRFDLELLSFLNGFTSPALSS